MMSNSVLAAISKWLKNAPAAKKLPISCLLPSIPSGVKLVRERRSNFRMLLSRSTGNLRAVELTFGSSWSWLARGWPPRNRERWPPRLAISIDADYQYGVAL
jgi:hypothetical protein